MSSMFESLYQPLPDAERYLDRIGIGRARRPTHDFLEELVYAHQCTVPFENLDVYENRLSPPLGRAELFDKIVVRRRGGYCFELNGLFCALLEELGFDVYASMARVLVRPTAYPMISHRSNIVTIGSTRHFVDVGFGGPMPGFAPALENGGARTEHRQTFVLRKCDEHWWNVDFKSSSTPEKTVLRFCTMPSEEHDFIALSFFLSQDPESTFRLNRMANIRTGDGAYDLRNSTFTEFKHGRKTSFEIEDAALDRVLAEKFGIVDWHPKSG